MLIKAVIVLGGATMATTLQTLGIDRLSIDERIALVQQIWDSISAEAERTPLTDAQRQELERRADDDDANPADTVPWEQVKAEALARWSR
jgi:putative addiction module component (TIGR02574 family)